MLFRRLAALGTVLEPAAAPGHALSQSWQAKSLVLKQEPGPGVRTRWSRESSPPPSRCDESDGLHTRRRKGRCVPRRRRPRRYMYLCLPPARKRLVQFQPAVELRNKVLTRTSAYPLCRSWRSATFVAMLGDKRSETFRARDGGRFAARQERESEAYMAARPVRLVAHRRMPVLCTNTRDLHKSQEQA